MKKIQRFLSLFLCALMLLPVLAACKPTPEVPENTTPPIETPPEEMGNPVHLIKDKISNYAIVYASSLSPEGVGAANELNSTFSNRSVQPVTYGKDTELAETPYEILIGNTNRPESAAVTGDLTAYSFIVRYVGTKVVICATEDWMLSAAITKFTQSMEYERDANKDINSIMIMDNLSILFDLTKDTSYSRDGWSISKFPAFFAGKLVEGSFSDTIGFNTIAPTSRNYKMTFASEVEVADFVAYADTLAANGFTVTAHAGNRNTIMGYWVETGKNRMYMYYTASTKEVRFIVDQNDSVMPEEFGYTYEKKAGESTTLYLYGLKMHPDGVGAPGGVYPSLEQAAPYGLYERYPELIPLIGTVQNNYKNCGAMYVIKLADNSVMIVDGGEMRMMCVEQALYLNDFLHEITDTPADEQVRISCWFITHPDGDHFTGMIRFLNSFHKLYTIERVMYNIDAVNQGPNDLTKIMGEECIQKWYPDVIYHRPHTGETFMLADMKIDIMATLEDLVNSESKELEDNDNPNNHSVVLRLTIDGRTVMITGDASNQATDAMLRNYAAGNYAELKVDMLQIPHHGWDNLPNFFSAVNPSISMFNQSSGGAQKGIYGAAYYTYLAVVAATKGGDANLYYSGDETVGFEVSNGDFVVSFREPAVGFAWDRTDGGIEYMWSTWTSFPAAYMPDVLK